MESGGKSRSYYSILGVAQDCDDDQIRRAYRKLAMRWHPDKWTKSPSLLGEAKLKFQHIQEAYSVLSDKRKRKLYDAGLYDHEEEYDEGFCDFLQEMATLMADVRKEGKAYSLEELQSMFVDMAKDFEYPQWSNSLRQGQQSSYSPVQWSNLPGQSQWSRYRGCQSSSNIDGSGSSKRARCDKNPGAAAGRTSRFHESSFRFYGNQFCY